MLIIVKMELLAPYFKYRERGQSSNFTVEKCGRHCFNHMIRVEIVVMELLMNVPPDTKTHNYSRNIPPSIVGISSQGNIKLKLKIKQLACILLKHQYHEIKCQKLFLFKGY